MDESNVTGRKRKYTAVRPKRYNRHFKLNKQAEYAVQQDIHFESNLATAHSTSEIMSSNEDYCEAYPCLTQISDSESSLPDNENHSNTTKPQLVEEIEKILFEMRSEGNLEEIEPCNIEEEYEMDEIYLDDFDFDFRNDCTENSGDMTENEPENNENEPIYAGHNMTVGVSMLLILIYSISHGISGSQLSDLLTLISLHCLKQHSGLRSLFRFQKYFADLRSPVKKYHFCKFCLSPTPDEAKTCTNSLCLRDISGENSKGYFLEISAIAQLKNLFQRDGFTDAIKHRFRRNKRNKSNIEDIYDGEVYQNLSIGTGPLSENYPFNISFTLNTDGIPIFKSSKFSIWPVYLMINELPKKERKLTENLILCGMWFGENKPFMPIFFKPLLETLKMLETSGIDIEINGHIENCKAFLLCTTADLPARSVLLNMNQFNGAFSCQKCCHEGQTFKTGKGGSVRIFPYSCDILQEKRSSDQIVQDAISANERGQVVNGIKGPSFLMCLDAYDFVKGSAIDYMHGVLLGITKLLITLWVSSKHSKEAFSVASYSHIIDKRLLEITPPAYITRVPRTISSHFKYWKASELRSWLFYYSLPVLKGILHASYFIHYAALVEAITLLCGASISEYSIQRSELLLRYFVMVIPELYGERYMTLNMHGLLHLPQSVRELGPLWVNSCFSFENANGQLTKLFHGTQNIELQIVSSVNIIQNLPSLTASLPAEYSGFVQRMQRSNSLAQSKCIDLREKFLGKAYSKYLPASLYSKLKTTLKDEVPNMQFFDRLYFRGQMHHSQEYTRVKQRNTYTVKYFCPESRIIKFGHVLFYGQHRGTNEQSFAFICPFRKADGTIFDHCEDATNKIGIQAPHIHKVLPTNEPDVVVIENLISVCVYFKVQDNGCHFYVCEPPNYTETD